MAAEPTTPPLTPADLADVHASPAPAAGTVPDPAQPGPAAPGVRGDTPPPVNTISPGLDQSGLTPQPPAEQLAKELGLDITAIDKQETTGAGKDVLEVQPPASKTASEALDSQHSTRAGGYGYKVEFGGYYYARASDDASSRAKIHKSYKASVNLGDLETALKVIKDGLGILVVRKEHPDALSLRTYGIIKATPLSDEMPESRNLRFMPYEALVTYIKNHPVEVTNPKTQQVEMRTIVDLRNPHYKNPDTLRAAIMDYAHNPRNFQKREARRIEERKKTLELARMNPEIAEELTRVQP